MLEQIDRYSNVKSLKNWIYNLEKKTSWNSLNSVIKWHIYYKKKYIYYKKKKTKNKYILLIVIETYCTIEQKKKKNK